MHSKQKGNIAEAAVELDLKLKGYSVFTEIGDYSKIDLIAEKNSKLITIQVKGYKPNKDGSIFLSFTKSGPNYKFRYSSSDFDYFALVNLETLEIGYIPSSILDDDKGSITLRVRPAKNNQSVNTQYLKDFKLPD